MNSQNKESEDSTDQMTVAQMRKMKEDQIKQEVKKGEIKASSETTEKQNTVQMTSLKQSLSQTQIESEAQELVARLSQKWNIEINKLQEEKKEIEKPQGKTLHELIEESKNPKLTKFEQLKKDIEQKTISDVKLQSKGNINVGEEYPIQYAYFMEQQPYLSPKYNVGEKWGDIVEDHAQRNLQFRNDINKKNLFWLLAKKGRFGVDLYAISFGIFGLMFIPLFFYNRHRRHQKVHKESIDVISKVKDWETSELDIDDISKQENYNNMYTKELNEDKLKEIKVHEEIQKLIRKVYPQKQANVK